jgi:hypothetical protein
MPQMQKTLGPPTEKMSQTTRREYLVRMRVRYQRRRKPSERKALLDEFCEVSGYERKYALKLLLGNRPGPARSAATRGKRGRVYGEDVGAVLRKISGLVDDPCGKRLKAMVPDLLPWYEVHWGVLESALRAKVLKVSAAQMDRLLCPDRPPGRRRPRAGSEARSQVPLRERPATATEPGWMQADTVWHCGQSTRGTFVCSLLMTCTFSHWTVTRATWNHSDRVVQGRIRETEQSLPFAILGCHTDNGGEFLNLLLIRYFRDRPVAVKQTRSRPYCKNDNAHAEERNRRKIRDFIGYERMGHEELAERLDALLQKWSLWSNLFVPTGKLLSRERIGSRVIKKHEKPQTPCQRLLASPVVSAEAKAVLRQLRAQTDPLVMRREINLLRDGLRERLATLEAAMEAAA